MEGVKRLSEKEIKELKKEIRQRDRYRCVIDGKHTGEVHEVLQKSSGAPRSSVVFRKEYMACVCNQCHFDAHHGGKKIEINGKILLVLQERFGYRYPKVMHDKFKF